MSQAEMVYRQIGRRLRDAREAMGLSQDEIADQLGITGVGYGRWETANRRIHIAELSQVAKVLQKPITFFLGEDLSAEQLTAWQYESLSPADQRMIQELIQFLMDRHNDEAA